MVTMSDVDFPRVPRQPSPEPHPTADGSFTFFSEEFGQLFHSHHGARQEAETKFVQPTRLSEIARQSSVLYLLDICYGLGYNTAAAIAAIWSASPNCRIVWRGLESNGAIAKAAIHHDLLASWSPEVRGRLAELAQRGQFRDARLDAELMLGDARQTLDRLRETKFRANAIFLDPFSPPACPQLWTVDFLRGVADCLSATGRLATYSCAAPVRAALREVGLHLGSTHPVGRKTPGTVASWDDRGLPPLSDREREHLQTRAAVPYRDPSLSDAAATIAERRRQEQQRSPLEPTTRWKKRWRSATLAQADDGGNAGETGA